MKVPGVFKVFQYSHGFYYTLSPGKSEKIFISTKSEYFCQMYDTQYKNN